LSVGALCSAIVPLSYPTLFRSVVERLFRNVKAPAGDGRIAGTPTIMRRLTVGRCPRMLRGVSHEFAGLARDRGMPALVSHQAGRSEEHTSELQSPDHLV